MYFFGGGGGAIKESTDCPAAADGISGIGVRISTSVPCMYVYVHIYVYIYIRTYIIGHMYIQHRRAQNLTCAPFAET
jgi:hypothetical protein